MHTCLKHADSIVVINGDDDFCPYCAANQSSASFDLQLYTLTKQFNKLCRNINEEGYDISPELALTKHIKQNTQQFLEPVWEVIMTRSGKVYSAKKVSSSQAETSYLKPSQSPYVLFKIQLLHKIVRAVDDRLAVSLANIERHKLIAEGMWDE